MSAVPFPSRNAPSILAIAIWTLLVIALGVAVALPEQPQDLVLGALASAAAVLSLIQPLVALPLLLFAVPFGGLARGSSGDSSTDLSFGAAEIVVALLTLAWLARGVRRHELNVRAGAIVVATLAMIALALFSIAYADDRPAAIKEALKWLELLIALVIVVDLAREARAARWVIGAMLVAGAAEATYGAVQFITDSGPGAFQIQGALRAFGHFDQPNPFAGYLTMILPLALCMGISRANPTPFRWLSLGAAALIAAGIGLSQSRGAWLGAAVAAACLLLAWSRFTRRLLIPGVLGGALAVALAISGVLPPGNPRSPGADDRVLSACSTCGPSRSPARTGPSSSAWLTGRRAGTCFSITRGWVSVQATMARRIPTISSACGVMRSGHAHNYYINILAELGLVGGCTLLLLLGLTFRQLGGALVGSEGRRHSFWRAVLAGVFGGLVVFCVHNMFDSLFVHSVNIQVGVLLGLGLLAADRLRVVPALAAAAR